MLKFLRVLVGLLLIASVVACLAYSQYYLHRTAEQFQSDFEHQNFEEFSRADTFALTQRLNALSRSSSWRCIVGRRNGKIFYQLGDADCRPSFLERAVEIVTESADGRIEVSFSLGLTRQVRSALFVLIGIQVLIFLALMQLTRKSDQLQHETEARVAALAVQVSHDIRSPLAALISIAHNSSNMDEGTRLQLRTAANRIRDIANQLLDRHREKRIDDRAIRVRPDRVIEPLAKEECRTQLLAAIIESIISQKRIQYADREEIVIEALLERAYGLFSSIQVTEFSRVLSNLINNGIEALSGPGVVTVSLGEESGHALVQVRDNGKGMPQHVLERLGSWGETHGKKGGSGLGVYHAKRTVESWDGKFQVESQVGVGTTVTMLLPKAEPPNWFVESISWRALRTIVILDDDPSIHQVWKGRFRQSGVPDSIPILHFYSVTEILDWFRKALGTVDEPLYLCDHELVGSNQTGLEVIELLGIAKNSILVTSRYEEPLVQERCAKFKIKLLPKSLVALVPIKL